ncbi:MAG: hypothetical protein K0R51_1975 [Cytophagaceae bacterium]|jgi:hypothetical protein|nr:hypothetical protein [Cytophagaceae bacterium]
MKVLGNSVILFLVVVCIQNASAQKVLKKVSKEACVCFGKIDLKQDTEVIDGAFAECLGNSLVSHQKELEKEYKMDFSEKLMDKMQTDLVNVLVSECEFMLKYALLMAGKEESSENDIVAVDSVVKDLSPKECMALHIGKFQYIKDGVLDTTKVLEFTKDNIFDYDNKGNLVTTSVIEWKSECSYVSSIVKTTSEDMKVFAEQKTKLEATIVKIDGNIITYKVKVFGVETYFQLKKIK